MPFYVYAFLGSITSAFFVITAKLTTKHSISNPWLFNFFLFFSIFVFMLPIALFNHAGLPVDWLPIILTAVFYSLFYSTWVFATYLLDITTLSPLFNFRVVFAVLFGMILFGERFSSQQAIYIILIIISGILASLDEKMNIKTFFKWSIFVGLMAVLSLSFRDVFLKYALIKNNYWTVNLWVSGLAFVFISPSIFFLKKEFKKIKMNQISLMGLLGLLESMALLFQNKAFSNNIAITSLIMNIPFSMIFAFAFSTFAPKLLEKHSLKIYIIRFGATAIMIWSAMQLTK